MHGKRPWQRIRAPGAHSYERRRAASGKTPRIAPKESSDTLLASYVLSTLGRFRFESSFQVENNPATSIAASNRLFERDFAVTKVLCRDRAENIACHHTEGGSTNHFFIIDHGIVCLL